MPTAHVLGLGKSGVAAARLLKSKGWQVEASDRGLNPSLLQQQTQLLADGISVELDHSPNFDRLATPIHLLIVSPGIPWDVPALARARQLGIETIGEVELGWRYLNHLPWLAITGTNGKTTTTALAAAIWRTAGFNAPACGNIGLPISQIALDSASVDWIIAELSSYQIESAPSIKPRLGIWTTFTPDHLDRHYTTEIYSGIKASLIRRSQQIILNSDDRYLAQHGKDLCPNAIWTSCDTATTGAYIASNWVKFGGESVLPLSKFKLLGNHNLQNLLMAVTAAKLAGIESAAIESAVTNFLGVPHRLELISDRDGVSFINDSKATNYDAAFMGLQSVPDSVILIAGGKAKQGDAVAWLELIKQKVATVLLIGTAAPIFAQLLTNIGYKNYEIVETLDHAVKRSLILATQLQVKTVLFSPACASFDQYANFEVRGDHFRQLCLEL
jgi:UDP-N-acetylmuramoylalanine--D-glutamate ligase